MKRILIGGTHSGCGKTTMTCAILKALQMRGLAVSSFKCGPDYIDPMFHREIIGTSSANLDSFFCDPETLRILLRQGSMGKDIAVIEGVMGYFDGMKSGASAYNIARQTDTPAVIVINARGMHETLGAVIEGFLRYRPCAVRDDGKQTDGGTIAGFLFNQLPPSLTGSVREMCAAMGTRFVGCLPRTDVSLESRNLGLVTAEEVPHLKEKLLKLGELALQYVDLDLLLELSECPPPEEGEPEEKTAALCRAAAEHHGPAHPSDPMPLEMEASHVYFPGSAAAVSAADVQAAPTASDADAPVIAVAKDRAFCFLYPENIRLLELSGCRIRYFSPLSDPKLPDDADGLYLCGGYPELYAQQLSENASMRASVYQAVTGGMPTIAECGGFLYLHSELRPEGLAAETCWPMAGVIDAAAWPKKTLHHFGYVTLTAQSDQLLCPKGETIRAHEFHYWDSEMPGDQFAAVKPDGRTWAAGIGTKTLYAGFPHLYFYANPRIAERFAACCMACRKRRNG